MAPLKLSGLTQRRIGPSVTPISSSTIKSGTRVSLESRLATNASTRSAAGRPKMRTISMDGFRTGVAGMRQHIRSTAIRNWFSAASGAPSGRGPRAKSRASIVIELAGAKHRAQPPQCPSRRCQRGIPDYERHIHHPARSDSHAAQQKGKEVPGRDVNVIPRIIRHRVIVEAPSFHLAEGERDDVLEAQRDHE